MIADNWEAVIGMEVHVQLSTASKMFCSCSTDYLGAPPNSHVCPVCLGMPGVLPVANRVAVEKVLKTALALNCEIPANSKFDRKNYFYPDLPKGYQISQYDLPLSRSGWIDIGGRRVRITRAHLEEDTGSLKHAGDALHAAQESLVDLNRSGMPLMEVVSEPDLHSAEEARDYAMALRQLLRYVGASEADMEKGQLRVEPNISVRRRGDEKLGVKTELKNLNSFRALYRGVEFEIRRQVELLTAGGRVAQETRGWSEPEQRTFSQRSKEYAQDYRYFPEPDLPPISIDPGWIERLRGELPELPGPRRLRLLEAHGLSEQDARELTAERATADYFEAVVAAGAEAKPAANWVIQESPTATPEQLAAVIRLVAAGTINRDQGRQVLDEATKAGRKPEDIVRDRGLAQLSDEAELGAVVDRVIAENPQAVADYRAGKKQAVGALLGQVSAATGRRADMKLARQVLEKRLADYGVEPNVGRLLAGEPKLVRFFEQAYKEAAPPPPTGSPEPEIANAFATWIATQFEPIWVQHGRPEPTELLTSAQVANLVGLLLSRQLEWQFAANLASRVIGTELMPEQALKGTVDIPAGSGTNKIWMAIDDLLGERPDDAQGLLDWDPATIARLDHELRKRIPEQWWPLILVMLRHYFRGPT